MTLEFQDIHETALQLGVSHHSIIKYIERDFHPLPYHLSRSNKVKFNGEIYELPDHLKSKSNQRKRIFEKEEVRKWMMVHFMLD